MAGIVFDDGKVMLFGHLQDAVGGCDGKVSSSRVVQGGLRKEETGAIFRRQPLKLLERIPAQGTTKNR